jgi:hypothetical protein
MVYPLTDGSESVPETTHAGAVVGALVGEGRGLPDGGVVGVPVVPAVGEPAVADHAGGVAVPVVVGVQGAVITCCCAVHVPVVAPSVHQMYLCGK